MRPLTRSTFILSVLAMLFAVIAAAPPGAGDASAAASSQGFAAGNPGISAQVACVDSAVTTWDSGAGANGHQYQLKCASNISWTDANAAARAAGGHLATSKDANENAFIAAFTSQKAWIGLNQAPGSSEPGGGFNWVTFESTAYTNWNSSEPNNCHAPSCSAEDSVAINDGGVGKWNDLPAVPVSAQVDAYVIEWEPGCNQEAQEWTTGAGGNGHFYQLVCNSAGINFDDAQDAAEAAGGNLATIGSSAENDFAFGVANQEGGWLINSFNCHIGPWLGGYQTSKTSEPSGNWAWVTGETWSYTNWSGGEPNNSGNTEDAMHFYGCSGAPNKVWNDVTNSILLFGYVVEYDETPAAECVTSAKTTWSSNGHQYQVVCAAGDGINFFDAQSSAAALGGMLVEITSAAENAFVFGLADDEGYWEQNGMLKGPWLGAWFHSGFSQWRWLSGVGFAYTAWGAGQPAGDPFTISRMHYASASSSPAATWANVRANTLLRAYVVEFDPALIPDTVIDTLTTNTYGFAATFRDPNSRRDRRFECQLDGGAWAACTSPYTINLVSAGDHIIRVRSASTVTGLYDPTPAERGFFIRGITPASIDTTITSGPQNPTDSRSAAFTFIASVANASFECALDGAGFSPCSSPANLAGLGIGEHTFRVRAQSGGTVDGSPATWIWRIADATPPPPSNVSEFIFRAGRIDGDAGIAFAWQMSAGSTLQVTKPGGGSVSCYGKAHGNWYVCWVLGQGLQQGEYVATTNTSKVARWTFTGAIGDIEPGLLKARGNVLGVRWWTGTWTNSRGFLLMNRLSAFGQNDYLRQDLSGTSLSVSKTNPMWGGSGTTNSDRLTLFVITVDPAATSLPDSAVLIGTVSCIVNSEASSTPTPFGQFTCE